MSTARPDTPLEGRRGDPAGPVEGGTSVTDQLRAATRRLAAAGAQSPAAEARVLLAHVLDCDLSSLLVAGVPAADQVARLTELVAHRVRGVPLQHLTGEAWFRTVRVTVGPGVFLPRPETEVMTGWAIDRLRELPAGDREPVVVELCAGSGAISLAIATEAPGCRQYAVELSTEAYPFLARNLAGTGVTVIEGDMADALHELTAAADLVICNPPYVPLDAFEGVTEEVRRHEPPMALFSGPDGLAAMRVLARAGARLLRSGGLLCAEHAELQEHSAPAVFVDHGAWHGIRRHRDLTERPRFVTAVRR